MVGSEEVDEQLQEEIEEECSKYGDVENVIIYQVKLILSKLLWVLNNS